jgi:hypothetical protein
MAAMPLQNKVDPFGTIKALPMRGLFMGNRGGRMHDPATKTLRAGKPWVTRQWICCLTEFKDRKRQLMAAGSYTELFFLDEVVSLAAGHRPCVECRRADYKRYCAAVDPNLPTIRAPDLDRRLHAERTCQRAKLTKGEAVLLPDGVMMAMGDTAYAKQGDFALLFNCKGYGRKRAWQDMANSDMVLLTPATTITALKNGYQPVWHPSAALDGQA